MSDTKPGAVEVEIVRPGAPTEKATGANAVVTQGDAAEMDFGSGLGPEDQEDEDASLETTPEPDQEKEDGDRDKPDEGDLPDYDPDNEETRAAYDKKYFTDGGKVNLQVLSAEFFANAAADDKGTGGLNAGTYAYLEDTLGLDKAAVQEIERGQLALREQATQTFYTKVGGKEAYDTAIAWAQGGGYTEAQRERYNALLTKGGAEFEDAAEALMARHAKATGKAAQGDRRGPPRGRRPSSPQRDVTGSSRTGSGEGGPKMTQAAYGQAWRGVLDEVAAAKKSGDKAAIRAAEGKRDNLRAQARRQGLA